MQICSVTDTKTKCDEWLKITTRSCIKSPKPKQGTGIYLQVCLFCGNARKSVNQLKQRLVNIEKNTFEDSVRKYAQWKKDDKFLTKISDIDLTAKQVKYHSVCRSNYQSAAIKMKQGEQGCSSQNDLQSNCWHLERNVHIQVFDSLTHYIEDTIILQSSGTWYRGRIL